MEKENKEKLYKDFDRAAQKVWDWLRDFQPYKQAYSEYQRRLIKKQAVPTFIEANILWYVCSDYELSKKEALKCMEYQDRFNEIWRFWPPLNPNNKKLPRDFFLCFRINFLNISPAVETLNDAFLELINNASTLKELKEELGDIAEVKAQQPKKLLLAINLSRNRNVVKEEVVKKVREFQERYKIPQGRPSFFELENQYKAKVLRALGKTHRQIVKEILPHYVDALAACKKVERLLS